MTSKDTAAQAPHLALKLDKLHDLRRAHGIGSDADLARAIGVDATTLYRVMTGKTAPSNAFMARLVLAFPTAKLDSLFELKRVAS
jgi:transcriptional regulator with XRE-family HTH domain